MWGPQYRGVVGGSKKILEFYFKPSMWPYTIGFLASGVLLTSMGVSDDDYRNSKAWNREFIMESHFKKHGHYPH